jgi:hypothetical protein
MHGYNSTDPSSILAAGVVRESLLAGRQVVSHLFDQNIRVSTGYTDHPIQELELAQDNNNTYSTHTLQKEIKTLVSASCLPIVAEKRQGFPHPASTRHILV